MEFAQTHVHWVYDAIQPSHLLSPPSPPASVFHSVNVFFDESALHIRWPKYWSFSFSISPYSEFSGLISLRIDWFDLLAVQESSPAPRFERVSYSLFSLLYGPTVTSMHNYWNRTIGNLFHSVSYLRKWSSFISFSHFSLSPSSHCRRGNFILFSIMMWGREEVPIKVNRSSAFRLLNKAWIMIYSINNTNDSRSRLSWEYNWELLW